MSLKYLSCPSKILADSITASSTSFKLNNIKGWDGNDLTSADFGTQAFAVIRNANNTLLELIEFDPSTIADASITIVRRGLKFTGDLTTEVSANKLSWTKGDTYIDIGVDTPQMMQWLQEYVDAAIVAGGVPATTSVLGLSKASVAPADPANPIFVGDNDPRVPTADENNALAGGGDFGSPSASNKFVTENYLNGDVQTFTASGTWNKPSIGKMAIIECWGAGGSGARNSDENDNDESATGGGGGSYAIVTVPLSLLPSTVSVTIGAGGASISTEANGNAGGNTSFGSYLIANGGGAGVYADSGNASGGSAGVIGSGSVQEVYSENGGAGGATTTGSPTASNGGSTTKAGAGGGSVINKFGGGQSVSNGGTSTDGGNGGNGGSTGTAGQQPGGGGGGATSVSGAGGDGKVVVTVI